MHSGALFFFFNDTATTEIYTLSLHDALPIFPGKQLEKSIPQTMKILGQVFQEEGKAKEVSDFIEKQYSLIRSEEHTSELQSRQYLVCRLLLEKKKYHPLSLHMIRLKSISPQP